MTTTQTIKVNGTTYNLEKGTDEWKAITALNVAQRTAMNWYKRRVRGQFYERTDLESVLVYEATKLLVKYDEKRCPNFEAFIQQSLNTKALTFLKQKKIDMYTATFAMMGTEVNEGEELPFEAIIDSGIDLEEDVQARIRLGEVKSLLSERDCQVLSLLNNGYTNSSELGRMLNTSHTSIKRAKDRIKKAMEIVYEI